MTRLIMAVATGMYVGMLPKFPATWGSIAAFLPWLLIKDLPLSLYLAALLFLFILGFFAAGSAEKILDQPDNDSIVIDEIVGMLVTLTLAPAHPAAWLLGFFLFRIFSIVKPFPVSLFKNNIHGSTGIMMDDVTAGIYACIGLQLSWHLFAYIS